MTKKNGTKAKNKTANKKSKKAPKTEAQKDIDFLEAYKTLCRKHDREFVPNPFWRYSEDGSDFRLRIQLLVRGLE